MRDKFYLHSVQIHWRAPWTLIDILYRIEPTCLIIYENNIIMERQTAFLVHFTILWPNDIK